MGSGLLAGLLLLITSIVAILVVISLIPVYLSVRDISVCHRDAGIDHCYPLRMKCFSLSSLASFLLVYESNYNGIALSWVSNIDQLRTEVDYSRYFHRVFISFTCRFS